MGILQARLLESVAMPSSRGSSQPKCGTQVSCIAGGFFTIWAAREIPLPFCLMFYWSVLKSVCISSKTRTKRKMLLVIHITEKGLITRICTELLYVNKTKTNNWIEMWARDFFFFLLHHAACGILVPRPGSELQQWKCLVLTTGLPGNSRQ